MPDHRWLAPLFWISAALSFLLTAFWLRGFDPIAGWVALAVGWLVGAVVGWAVVTLFRWRFPDTKYLTPEKIDDVAHTWTSVDVLMPYLITGVCVALLLLLMHFNPSRRPNPYSPFRF